MSPDRFEQRARTIAYIMIAVAVLAATIVRTHPSESATGYIDCPLPPPGEKLVVTGSSDGKPFCVYYPILGWGKVR